MKLIRWTRKAACFNAERAALRYSDCDCQFEHTTSDVSCGRFWHVLQVVCVRMTSMNVLTTRVNMTVPVLIIRTDLPAVVYLDIPANCVPKPFLVLTTLPSRLTFFMLISALPTRLT